MLIVASNMPQSRIRNRKPSFQNRPDTRNGKEKPSEVNATTIAVFSALIASVAAGVAIFQAHTAVTVPFRSVLYGQRATALNNFVLASGNLNAALAKARVDMPWDIEQPGSIASDTDAQMRDNARAAAAVISAHGTYLAGVNASIPLWTDETRAKIGASISASKIAADCYVQLGSHAGEMTPEYWADTRARAAPSCERAVASMAYFSQAIAAAEGAMISELRRTESEDLPPGKGDKANPF